MASRHPHFSHDSDGSFPEGDADSHAENDLQDGSENDDDDKGGDEDYDEDDENDPDNSDQHSRKRKKKREASILRKAPQAPKRFKSSYICFFMAKQSEIKAELGDDANVTAVSRRSAEMWKNLPPDERAYWDEVAAKDKQRYMTEKATYTGPWQIPWKRVKKDPSAFLFYSLKKRHQIKKENPDMKNTDVSRVLGEMWRSLNDEERQPFVDKEKEERDKYKVAIAEWRKKIAAKQTDHFNSQIDYSPQHHFPPAVGVHMDHYAPAALGASSHIYQPVPHPTAFSPGPFQLPTNGKQHVILGPNGMPLNQAGTGAHINSAFREAYGLPSQHSPPPHIPTPLGFPPLYDDGSVLLHGDYGVDSGFRGPDDMGI